MDVGFTGTQLGMTLAQKELTLQFLRTVIAGGRNTTAHHGLCIGADTHFHYACKSLEIPIIGHPPINQSKMTLFPPDSFLYLWDPREYLDRNKDIVRCSDILIATPAEFTEQLRSGTWSTIRFARKTGKQYFIIYPDGKVVNSHDATSMDISLP